MLMTYRGRMLDGRGEGVGASYRPYYKCSEISSSGTCCEIIDWKHGRSIQCLSQSEAYWYYKLRFDENVAEIREQYPLPRDVTDKIAAEAGWEHPKGRKIRYAPNDDYLYYRITTDFLVIYKDGSRCAYSVKYDRVPQGSVRSMYIEKKYWLSQGVLYRVVFGVDVNRNLYTNIRTVVQYYDMDTVMDARTAVMHLIAHNRIIVDLEKGILGNAELDYIADCIRKEGILNGNGIDGWEGCYRYEIE